MPVTATEAPPEIDNIYLDMNGIIHNCTHANDPTLRLTETEMVLRIFMYLDKLIHITKPKKLVFLAIDGAHASAALPAAFCTTDSLGSCARWSRWATRHFACAGEAPPMGACVVLYYVNCASSATNAVPVCMLLECHARLSCKSCH